LKQKERLFILLEILKTMILLVVAIGILFGIAWFGWSFYNNLFTRVPDIIVPSVVNKDIIEARNKLEKVGLIIETEDKYSENTPKGMIISQKPESGKKVKKGRKIIVVVSLGTEMVNVPNLKGLSSRDGEMKLKDVGLKFSIKQEIPHDNIPAGKIISQFPAALTIVSKNTPVKVIISRGKETPVEVPDMIGKTLEDTKNLLEKRGLNIGKIIWIEDTRFKAGTVVTQVPPAKGKLPPGSLISLEVVAGKNLDNVYFQQDLIKVMVPESQDEVLVSIFVTDRYGKSKLYEGYHKSEDKFDVTVSTTGGGMLEIFFNDKLGSKAEL
jgi:serine/threonine-protein kinase